MNYNRNRTGHIVAVVLRRLSVACVDPKGVLEFSPEICRLTTAPISLVSNLLTAAFPSWKGLLNILSKFTHASSRPRASMVAAVGLAGACFEHFLTSAFQLSATSNLLLDSYKMCLAGPSLGKLLGLFYGNCEGLSGYLVGVKISPRWLQDFQDFSPYITQSLPRHFFVQALVREQLPYNLKS